MVSRAFSALYVYSKIVIILIPWATFVPSFVSVAASVAELAHEEKSRTHSLTQSLNHQADLMRRELKQTIDNEFYVRTSKSNEIVSMEMTCLRAKFCSVPVRNACGKKKPEIQKTYNNIDEQENQNYYDVQRSDVTSSRSSSGLLATKIKV